MKKEELQNVIESLVTGRKYIRELDDSDFEEVIAGLARMYSARIFNCVDARGKSDDEWAMLSSAFGRISERFQTKENKQ